MPSTQRTVPINEEMLKKALQNRNMSKYRLFKNLEDIKDYHGNPLITARSAQRAFVRGNILPNVRDAIARMLNVTPEYLAGEIIDGDTDPDHYQYSGSIPIAWLKKFRSGLDSLSESKLMDAIDTIIDAYMAEREEE